MSRDISLIRVPSSAGASWAGLEKGPAAYGAAGILERLEEHGLAVEDAG